MSLSPRSCQEIEVGFDTVLGRLQRVGALDACVLLTQAAGLLGIPVVATTQNSAAYGALMPEVASVRCRCCCCCCHAPSQPVLEGRVFSLSSTSPFCSLLARPT